MTPALEARDLTKAYSEEGQTVMALDHVDLSVGEGELVAITGPSGSGKSTLLHLLGGLDRPDSGSVLIGGQTLSDLVPEALARVRNRQVGFVFQFFNLIPSLTVAENVALPAVIAKQRDATYQDRVRELLAEVGLEAKRSRYPAQLSGGEQQRVAIARALMMRPAVVLADEPTGNLDTKTGNDIVGLLNRYHADGQTIVMVTHDVRVATGAQRIIFLRDGAVMDEARLTGPDDQKRAATRMVLVEDE